MKTIEIDNGHAVKEDNFPLVLYRNFCRNGVPNVHTFSLSEKDLIKIFDMIDIEKIKKHQRDLEKDDLPW